MSKRNKCWLCFKEFTQAVTWVTDKGNHILIQACPKCAKDYDRNKNV